MLGAASLVGGVPAAGATPSSLSAIASSSVPDVVDLSWTLSPPNTDIDNWQYRFKTGTDNFRAWIDISGSDANTRTHAVSDLAIGTQYTFQVRAVIGGSEQEPSPQASATPNALSGWFNFKTSGCTATLPANPARIVLAKDSAPVEYGVALFTDDCSPMRDHGSGGRDWPRAWQVRVIAQDGFINYETRVRGEVRDDRRAYDYADGQNRLRFWPPSGRSGTGKLRFRVNDVNLSGDGGGSTNLYHEVDFIVPGLTVTPTSLSLTEGGGEGTFTVALGVKPSANVTVAVSSDDPGAATVRPPMLTFTPADYATAQTVTVTPVDDTDATDERVTVSLDASGAEYADTDQDVTVTIEDNYVGLVLAPTVLTLDEGATRTFTVALATEPSADVTVAVSGAEDVSITDGASLTFTTTNYATAQTVTLRAAEDADGDDDTATVNLIASGGGYADVTGSVTATVRDNDPKRLVHSPTSLEVDEGGSDTFTVKLATEPTAPVTVTVTSDDTDVTVSPTPLTFSTTDYGTAQTVTVSMAASPADGDATIALSASGGGYDSITASVSVSSNALPSFGTATIDDKVYTQGTAITTITLPEATGGDAPRSYALSPALPMGLAFDATTRTLSGTPTVPQAAAEYTYTVTDTDNDTAELKFDIRVAATLTIRDVADADQAENAAYTGTAALAGGPIGAVSWTLEGADAGAFTLTSPSNAGVTVGLAGQDYEAPTDADTNGVYEYTLKATDADGNIATKAVSVTITDVQETATLTIGGVDNDNQAENGAYSGAATLAGGPIGAVSWTLEGADASAFTLTSPSNAGVTVGLVGQDYEAPTDADTNGVYEYTLKATDADGNIATKAVSVTITDVQETATLTIGGVDNDNQAENAAYTGAATLAGGPIGAVSWTLEGADAAAFTLTSPSNAGVTVGLVGQDYEAPTDADTNGVYEYTLKATDADGNIATKAVSVTITDVQETATLTIGGVDNDNQAENAAYTGAATLAGGPIGAVSWTLEGADAAAFTLTSPSNAGVTVGLVGQDYEAPTDADTNGVYEYTLKATDADGNIATKAVELTITDVQETATLTISGLADDTVNENAAFAETATLANAIGGVTWELGGADGALFVLSGESATGATVTLAGQNFEVPADADAGNTYEYTLKATDADDNTVTSATYTVTVQDVTETAPVTASPDLTPIFGTATIADQIYVQNTAIATLTLPQAFGGNGTRTYSLRPAVPAGLTFDARTRTLTGTPTQPQPATRYTYTATDADGDTTTRRFSITVKEDLTPSFGTATIADQTYVQNTAIQTLTLPPASGGDGTLTHSLSPAAPSGLTFDASARTLSGTPTQAQPATSYSYTATDADGDSVSLTFVVTVEADLAPSFGTATIAEQSYVQNTAIATLTLPQANGGNGALTYSLSPTAPAGLTFDASARTLGGTPTAAQPATPFTYTVTDADGDTATLTFSISVTADLTPSFGDRTIANRSHTQHTAIATLTLPRASSGDGTVTYSLSPAAPAGLTFDADTRTMTGAPTQAQPATSYTYTATDADGDTATLTFTITVETLPVPTSPSGLAASAGDGQVGLRWADPGNGSILRYQVRYRADASFGPSEDGLWQDIPGSSATTTNHTVTGLTNRTQYVFQVRAVNASGEGAASAQVTATPEGAVSLEDERRAMRSVLSEIARATLAGATEMVDERVRARSSTNSLTLAGRQVSGAGWSEPSLDERVSGLWDRTPGDYAQRIGGSELLRGSAFTLSLSSGEEADGASEWTMWGRGDVRSFSGRKHRSDWDGSLGAGWLGVDVRASEQVFAGLALSQSRGEVDYRVDDEDGALETSLTTVWPYLQMAMGDGVEVQVLLGVGSGDAEHRSVEDQVSEATLSMTAGSVGARWPVLSRGSMTLSAVTDAGAARMETEGSSAPVLDGVKSRVWRVRGGLEAAHAGMAITGSQWSLAPRGTVTVRRDGGDGVTGTGVELGGGVRFWGPAPRLSVDASGHWLGLHSEDGVREWSARIEAGLAPGAGGRGLSWSLGPRWGVEREGMLESERAFHRAVSTGTQDSVFAARAGYGMGTAGGRMTPYAEMELGGGEDGVQRYGAGVEFELREGITATVRGEHHEAADADTRIGLDLRVRF